MFAKFGRVSEACVSELGGMVSVSRLEVVFSKSNVCFGRVVVVPGDGGLVDDDVWQIGVKGDNKWKKFLGFLNLRFERTHLRVSLYLSATTICIRES